MTWNYRIILHDTDPDPDKQWYGLHEVFYGVTDDKPDTTKIGPQIDPATFCCGLDEGPEVIIKMMERALVTLRDPQWAVIKESEMKGKKG
jgi:hypothetical protein